MSARDHEVIFPVEEKEESRTLAKIKQDPLFAAGLVGWVGIVGYGIHGIKNRKHDLAVHLIHTRVIAQAAVVCGATIGITYKMYKDHFKPWMWPAEIEAKKN